MVALFLFFIWALPRSGVCRCEEIPVSGRCLDDRGSECCLGPAFVERYLRTRRLLRQFPCRFDLRRVCDRAFAGNVHTFGNSQIDPVTPGYRLTSAEYQAESDNNGEGTFHFDPTDGGGEIAGCGTNVPFGSQRSRGISTCGHAALVEFSWLLPGEWKFTSNTRLQMGKDGSGGQENTFTCTTGVDCYTVPEPDICLLMLTGLFGLGFVGWRRREALG